MIEEQIFSAAQTLWDYHKMNHELVKSDCILALGSHDLRVAERAARLYLEHYAPIIIMSGGLGNFTKEMWTEKEADKFARVAMNLGVPAEKIIVENESSNTGENILFTEKILKKRKLDPEQIIIVQKPYMERRAYATVKRHWPQKEIIVTSPEISFKDYPTEDIPLDKVINIMVGDLERIKIYPAKGFQVPQEIPEQVWQAFESLVNAGYTKHLIKT